MEKKECEHAFDRAQLVTSLGATAAPQPAEAAVSGQTIVNQGDGILRQGAVCFWRHEN